MKSEKPAKIGFNRKTFEPAFRDFLAHVVILSKDEGYVPFRMWAQQEYALTEILDGLEKGIHWFVILKARQLGITTLSLLLDIFWCGMYPGLQGTLVCDTDGNKDKFRLLIEETLDHLPPGYGLAKARHNRTGIVFEHADGNSMLDYLVAGVRKKSGSLGRSRAYNFGHLTEVSSYGDEDGFESLVNTFSERYPARFYLMESTALGYNLFYDQWNDAVEDDLAKKAIFIGWWRHPNYRIDRKDPLFRRYGYAGLSDYEKETNAIVEERYGVAISLEQWAWYRHRADPQRREGGMDIAEHRVETMRVEYPSYPEEAFRMTGTPFLNGAAIQRSMEVASTHKFLAYQYHFGHEFRALQRRAVMVAKLAHLKVWEPPHPNGRYVVGADPAYGSGEGSDRYCVQVCRVYADRIVQVAEFCVVKLEPFQFTWIIAELCGWYRNARLILEINGPGEAVMTEFRHLHTMLETGLLNDVPGEQVDTQLFETEAERKRMPSPLSLIRTYLYHRADALGGSFSIQWKTTGMNKPVLLTQFGDHFMMGNLVVNSIPCLEEMRHLSRKGDQIEAEGRNKDDRPIALALCVRAWLDWDRQEMNAAGETFELVTQRDNEVGESGNMGYMAYIMRDRADRRARELMQGRRRASRDGRWDW